MPINPGADYKIKPETEKQDDLLKMFLQGGNEAYNTAAQGLNQRALATTQEKMKEQGTEHDLGLANDQKVGAGDSVKVGDVSRSRSGEGKMLQDALKGQAAAIKHTQDTYNHAVKPIMDQAQAVHEIQQIASNPSQMNVGMARSAALKALGMNRFNEAEAENILPGTAQSGLSKIFASAGKDEDALNDGQIQALNNFKSNLAKTIKQRHETVKNMALSQYAQNPYADPNRADMLKSTLGADMEKQIAGLEEAPKPRAPVSGMATVTQPAAPGGMLDRLAGFLSGNKGAPAQAQAPQTAAVSGPQAPGGDLADLARQELAKRRGGK